MSASAVRATAQFNASVHLSRMSAQAARNVLQVYGPVPAMAVHTCRKIALMARRDS